MSTVNINRKVTDSYYRYKMPKIQAKVEGRGNGIKTVVVNLSDVSKALGRPPLYPLKFIGCELGAQTIADTKNDRFIVNGAHDADKLQNILDGFIEKYVLCTSCSNPETCLSVFPKKEQIVMKCIACGNTYKIPTVHRVSTYILKNPQSTNTKEKISIKKLQKLPNNSSTSTTITTSDQNDTSDIIDNNVIMNNCVQFDGDDDNEHWNADVSENAVKKRQEMLSSHLRALTLDDDTNKPIHEKLEILRQFITDKISIDKNLDNHFDDIACEVKRLEIESKAIFAISGAIFDNNIVQQLSSHHAFLRRFCSEQHRVQKYLLASIERIIEQHLDQLITKVPVIFKIMFEAEIIDEEVFLEWDSKKSSRFVSKETSQKIKTAAFKFMDWLKNAEEESSDNDDEQLPTNIEMKNINNCHINNNSTNITSFHSNGMHIQTMDPHNEHDEDKSDINIDDI